MIPAWPGMMQRWALVTDEAQGYDASALRSHVLDTMAEWFGVNWWNRLFLDQTTGTGSAIDTVHIARDAEPGPKPPSNAVWGPPVSAPLDPLIATYFPRPLWVPVSFAYRGQETDIFPQHWPMIPFGRRLESGERPSWMLGKVYRAVAKAGEQSTILAETVEDVQEAAGRIGKLGTGLIVVGALAGVAYLVYVTRRRR